MKKIILFTALILAVVLSLCCCNPDEFTAANVYDRYELDEDGNRIRVQVMHEFGNKENIQIERYHDKDGVLVYEIDYRNYFENDIAQTITYHKSGNRHIVTAYSEDGTYTVDEHDESDRRLYSKEYSADGKLCLVYNYYPSGYQESLETYNDNEVLINRRKFTDEDQALVTEDYSVYFDADKTTYATTVFDNRITVSCDMIAYTPGGEFIEHRYDEFSENGEIYRSVQYDEAGNVISEDVFHK